jgi:diaminopropionate ammonia-lyase
MNKSPEPQFPPTPLLDLPEIARIAKVARVFVKDEGQRPLGNFKVLGGMLAGIRALDRANVHNPRLICASDGNHGLAVAAAAKLRGASARIYLPTGASIDRAARIRSEGGEIAWIRGTYDDAVNAAIAAADQGEGILVPDTTSKASDPIVDDVMLGYGRICHELLSQLPEAPTHLFVQAGVGGLTAALAIGLRDHMAAPAHIVVVEPEAAACVGAGLAAGRPVQIEGDLETCADMLSCGLASAPALEILIKCESRSLSVNELALERSARTLKECEGPWTTPSGAAGLAGFLHAAGNDDLRNQLEIGSNSKVLLIATEQNLSGR